MRSGVDLDDLAKAMEDHDGANVCVLDCQTGRVLRIAMDAVGYLESCGCRGTKRRKT